MYLNEPDNTQQMKKVDRLPIMLADCLDAKSVKEVLGQLRQNGLQEPVLDLLTELGDISPKVQSEALKGLGELSRRRCVSIVVSWLDLGITLAQASGALGLRYFKESPLIIECLGTSPKIQEVLSQLMELADRPVQTAPQCVYEFFKVLPQFSEDMTIGELQQWACLGLDLAEWNYVLGNEFFKESPAIQKAIPLDLAREWVTFGIKLMVPNSLGKPDYVGTLEFFRSSPTLFKEFPEPEIKRKVIELGVALAQRSPEQAVKFLAEAPGILAGIPSEEWKIRALQYGLLIADRDGEAALAYCRAVSEIIRYSDPENTDLFDTWFGQGMEALTYSVEAGRAFFGLETRQACSVVEETMTAVPLRQILRSLRLFARALCGEDVNIEPLKGTMPSGKIPETSISLKDGERSKDGDRAMVSDDGKTIHLPLVMRRSSTWEGNRRWYTAMVAHEMGHLEFGTYRISSKVLQEAGHKARVLSSGFNPEHPSDIQTLGEVFQLYPQPGLIRDLWEILEDARVDYLVKQEYPGLREDFLSLVREAIQVRTLTHGMTAREMVLDGLLIRFAGLERDLVSEPVLHDVLEPIWEKARSILHPGATVDDTVLLAGVLYQDLERLVGRWNPPSNEPEPFPGESGEEHAGATQEAAEHLVDEYRPIDNWGYRSAMDPGALTGQSDTQENPQSPELQNSRGQSSSEGERGGTHFPEKKLPIMSPDQDSSKGPRFGESPLEQWFQPENAPQGQPRGRRLETGHFLYDEWDGWIRDYRPGWCRVVEHEAPEGSPDFVDDTLRTYGSVVNLIRRYFECIRPEAFRRIGRQSDGEEIDFDAMVNWFVDRKSGNEPSDEIYARRQKRDRQVAVAFLIDMSGSTGRQLGSFGRTVNAIEKEGLLLLSEALNAVGDHFAIYGFSGQSRQLVDLHVIKDFECRSGGRVGLKISGITPRQQNRDGTAIRHAAFRLMEQEAKVRLLVLLSDGKPLDDEYTDEYALEDTRMALREARLKGIHPFCITIDQAPTDYVKRMYGEIGFLVVDEVESLPIRLPKVYQHLTAK